MLVNYLKIALRTLRRHKGYAFISISGLAVGIACCLLIVAFVSHEWSYDRFHERPDEIYRLHRFEKRTDGERAVVYLPPPLAPTLAAELPEEALIVRLFVPFNEPIKLVHLGETWFKETVLFADPGFFELFHFPLRHGHPATALEAPGAVVLSAETALAYFGTDNPIGRSLSIRLGGQDREFTVSGVAETIPSNSSIRFKILLPYPNVQEELQGFYGEHVLDSWNFFTEIYLRLPPGVDPAVLEARLPTIANKYLGSQIEHWKASGRLTNAEDAFQLRLQPLPSIHLNPALESSLTPTSLPAYSYVLSGIALLLLLLACINFMLLSIGHSVRRSREVGVRKVLGATRAQVMHQFWGEAFLLVLFALGLGSALSGLMLPTFNGLAGTHLTLGAFTDAGMLLTLFGLMVLTGLMAGSYPAAMLSGFRPAAVLRGDLGLGRKRWLTSTLIAFQFVLSIGFIISMLTMLRQVDFLYSKDMGFTEEHVVVLPTYTTGPEGQDLLDRLKQALSSHPNMVSVSGSDGAFAQTSLQMTVGSLELGVPLYRVDYDYLETLGIELTEGRNFSREIATDPSNAVLINESMVRAMGWDTAVGKEIPYGFPAKKIIGVVKDYHFEALYHEIRPLVLHIFPGRPITNLFVRISPERRAETMHVLKTTWQSLPTGSPFTYYFLDDDVAWHYQADERWGRMIGYATFLALFISCLGLLGLTSVIAAQRTKEVGILKVLGASAAEIVALLSRDVLMLVGIAFVVAAPIAYLVMRRWLDGFAYHIDLGVGTFALAGVLALGLAWLTVSYQSVKAALADPVDSLRYE